MPCPAGGRRRRWSEVSGSAFTRLGAVVARYHRLVVAVWVVLVVGSAILVPRFQSSVTGPPLDVLASDSYRAQEILGSRFDQPFAEQDLIVFES
jgi:RND superfamily putative drug exporter